MTKAISDLTQKEQEILVERALIGIDQWIAETKAEHQESIRTHNIQWTNVTLERLNELNQERELYREINKSFLSPLQDTK